MRAKLPISTWGHAILHAATLIRIRPISYHEFSPLQLVHGQEPNIYHLRIFGCAVYIPITPPHRTKMGTQRRLGIYVGYESPSIIKYLEPSTKDLFTARFADCHFDEKLYPTLGGETKQVVINWNELSLSHYDPRTKQCEQKVQKIIHLQNLASQPPYAFTDPKIVTKSHIPIANAPIRIVVPEGQLITANEIKGQLKRGRPVGSKDTNPRKRKGAKDTNDQVEVNIDQENFPSKTPDESVSKENKVPKIDGNEEISINYVMTGERWNQNEIIVDDIFAYHVAQNVANENEDLEPMPMEECRHREDWPKWKEAIDCELKSLAKRKVFGPVVLTPYGIKHVGYKWVFLRK